MTELIEHIIDKSVGNSIVTEMIERISERSVLLCVCVKFNCNRNDRGGGGGFIDCL